MMTSSLTWRLSPGVRRERHSHWRHTTLVLHSDRCEFNTDRKRTEETSFGDRLGAGATDDSVTSAVARLCGVVASSSTSSHQVQQIDEWRGTHLVSDAPVKNHTRFQTGTLSSYNSKVNFPCVIMNNQILRRLRLSRWPCNVWWFWLEDAAMWRMMLRCGERFDRLVSGAIIWITWSTC